MTIPPWQFSHSFAPKLIKRLIQLIGALTFGCVLIDSLFQIDLQRLLALTPYAIDRFYIWQFVTSLFIIPTPLFSFGFMLDVAFGLLLLWLIGTLLYERIGIKKFIFTYVLTGIIGGLGSLWIMHTQNSFALISQCYFAILAITTLWTMADPYQQLFLFFVLPIQAKWLLVLALAGTLLGNFFQGDLILAGGYLATFVFTYFYGLFVLQFRSPFDWMQGFDRFCKKIRFGVHSFWQWRILGWFRSMKAKEDAFVDRTLEKINQTGEKSLTLYERVRLKWISFKRPK